MWVFQFSSSMSFALGFSIGFEYLMLGVILKVGKYDLVMGYKPKRWL